MLFNQLIKVLIIDDDEEDYYLLRDYLDDIAPGIFQTSWSKNYEESLEDIKSGHNDIYFIDYYLGSKTGEDLLKEAIASGCQEPIIMLTGKGNRDVDIEAMQ